MNRKPRVAVRLPWEPLSRMPALTCTPLRWGPWPDPGRRNIDVGLITNDLSGTYNSQDGHLNKVAVRNWSWDTKGFSGIGDGETYGTGTKTFQIPLDFYFSDRTYVDANNNGVLEENE